MEGMGVEWLQELSKSGERQVMRVPDLMIVIVRQVAVWMPSWQLLYLSY